MNAKQHEDEAQIIVRQFQVDTFKPSIAIPAITEPVLITLWYNDYVWDEDNVTWKIRNKENELARNSWGIY